jgi:secretion/DNA translocation related TadE-like protein
VAGHNQRGSGTVLVAGVCLAVAAVAAVILVVGGYLVAAGRARGAADLVALSAAAERARGGDACRAAAGIARDNSVVLVRCAISGDSLDFVAQVTVRQPVRVRLPLLPDGVPATSLAGRLGVVSRD